jgi:hypothetical protein
LKFPAVPSPNPGLPPPAVPGPSRQSARRPAALFLLAVAGAALCVLAALGVGVFALVSKSPSTPSGNEFSVEHSEPVRDETSEPAPTLPAAVPPEPEPAHAAPAPQREDTSDAAPAEWPPARAFTARCRAPGGGCAPECAELAGGRCLDPCFIHTPDCSKDCLKPDGTCGWPPPDAE